MHLSNSNSQSDGNIRSFAHVRCTHSITCAQDTRFSCRITTFLFDFERRIRICARGDFRIRFVSNASIPRVPIDIEIYVGIYAKWMKSRTDKKRFRKWVEIIKMFQAFPECFKHSRKHFFDAMNWFERLSNELKTETKTDKQWTPNLYH